MRAITIGLLLALWPAVVPAQDAVLRVVGPSSAGVVLLAPDDLSLLPHDTVQTRPHRGPAVRYVAVSLPRVLARAGTPLDSLRVGRTAGVVVAEASDGYRVVFSAAELEPGLGPTQAWLAYRRVDGPLSAEEAPWRLVVPTDGRPPRSAHRIVRLRIVAVPAG